MTREQREQAAEVLEKFQNGTYGHGGKVGVAIDTAIAALRQPGWVRTADRLPEGDEHDEILGLYNGPGYLLYDIVQIGWLRLHPEMYVYWTHLPGKPDAES